MQYPIRQLFSFIPYTDITFYRLYPHKDIYECMEIKMEMSSPACQPLPSCFYQMPKISDTLLCTHEECHFAEAHSCCVGGIKQKGK